MFTRRHILRAGAGAVLDTIRRKLGPTQTRQRTTNINQQIDIVARRLRAHPLVADASFRPAENPAKGLIQWKWGHYREDIYAYLIPDVALVNQQLFRVMDETRLMPEAEFHLLMQEGITRNFVDFKREKTRDDIRKIIGIQLEEENDSPPTDEEIEKGMKVFARYDRVTPHSIYKGSGTYKAVKLSPLTRFGAGYCLAFLRGITLEHAEDPSLNVMADIAERDMFRQPEKYQKWVIDKRDEYFVKAAAEIKRRIVHLIVGYSHDLTDDIARHNAENEEGIAHLVVTVKRVAEMEEKDKVW